VQVLIAHGGERSRQALVEALSDSDYEPVLARDGADALECLTRADPPRVVLVDWDLPGLAGPHYCRLARGWEPAQPLYVIVLTRAALGRDVRVVLDAGANDCLATPVSADQLRAHVELGRRFVELPLWRTVRGLRLPSRLPGVCDREAILQRLSEELARARRQDIELSVVLLTLEADDVSRDEYDDLVAEVARRLRGTLRPYDAIGRVSRSEFLVIVPGTSEAHVDAVLKRLHDAVEVEPLSAVDGALPVRVSFGAATGIDERAEELVVRAHEALEKARELGATRIVADRKIELSAMVLDERRPAVAGGEPAG
jgi:two-component system cell cycle response regulator